MSKPIKVKFDCPSREEEEFQKLWSNQCQVLPDTGTVHIPGLCHGMLPNNFYMGIDFTGSNGDPRSPQSLHYLSPDVLNPYLAATWSVGLVVQDYDTPSTIDGFGYCFNTDFCSIAILCPTHHRRWGDQTLDQTRDAIVKASRLPMSIIIGVGEANFKAMELLEGDEGILKSPSGEPVARDIVQFANDPKEALAQSVLAEVPNQLVSYFKMLKLDPVNVAAIKT